MLSCSTRFYATLAFPCWLTFGRPGAGPAGWRLRRSRELLQSMAGHAVVLKVDTERHPELAARFNIRGIPYFAVFYGGKPVVQQAGVVGHQQLESWLRSASAPAA